MDDECEGRQRARVQEVRGAAKRRKELEAKRRKDLSDQIAVWRDANEIRTYLKAIRRTIDGGDVAPTDPGAFDEWFDWATWYADRLDPLTPTLARPEFVVSPTNTTVEALDLTSETRPIVDRLGVKDTDELHAIPEDEVTRLSRQSAWQAWREIRRVLEGLGYDVSCRYHDW